MIKHLSMFLIFTFSIFAFDDAYLEVIENEMKNNNVETVTYNIPAVEIPESLDAQKSGLSTSSIIIGDIITEEEVVPVNKRLKTPDDIKIFTSKTIEPINYTNTISLKKLQVSEKKQKFFHMILPAILISKENLRLKRERVLSLMNTSSDNMFEEDKAFLEKLYKKYRTDNIHQLANRLKTHPASIILAQAAIESAWGESRFFKKGNNIFGMWSYNRNEPRIRALGTRNGKAIYVKKYASVSEAIDDYFVVIGRGAYKNFRKHRSITDNPLKLVAYLVNYCELKEKYTHRLKSFIVHNKLRKFDDFKLVAN